MIMVNVILLMLMIINLRAIRSLFPPAIIGDSKSVGYVHYFGYPLHFDSIFFYFMVILPFIIVLSYKLWQKGLKK